jgi:uncharacterized protein YjbI with pentapeptide repeats
VDESSGIRDNWTPATWPADQPTAKALHGWLEGTAGETFYGVGLDFSDADLSGADLFESWLSRSTFHRTRLRDASLGLVHCEEADFTAADLSRVDLRQASGNRAVLEGARLVGARLGNSEFRYAYFAEADLTGADLGDAYFSESTFFHTDLTNATADKLMLRNAVFDSVTLAGFSGTVIGPIVVVSGGRRAELDDEELEEWFAAHGANVTRFRPPREPGG